MSTKVFIAEKLISVVGCMDVVEGRTDGEAGEGLKFMSSSNGLKTEWLSTHIEGPLIETSVP